MPTPLILFDVDLTLIRTNLAGRAAMTEAFRGLFGVDDATAGISFDGRTDRAIFEEAIALHGLANGDLPAVYERVIRAYLEALPAALAARSGGVLPGVEALLDALRGRAAVGLATGNMRLGAKAKLAHFGLWERFAAGGFGDDTPVRAHLVRLAIENLAAAAGVDPDPGQAVVIGDTPLDVEAARLAGARAMGVATGSYTVEGLRESRADFVVPDLATPGTLEMLLG
jgi:phosphoglycolate phosphatase-like HAD superfamily hydrolase